MAWGWVVPMAAGVGLVAWRSRRQDAAIRSGELMDLRDALPGGEADVEIRVLPNRRYRVELQLEASVEARSRRAGAPADATDPGEPREEEAARPEAGLWPFELVVAGADGTQRGGGEGVVHHATGALEPLLTFAARARRTDASPDGPIVTTAWAGSAPLLELTSDALVRLRFELSIRTEQTTVADGIERRARLAKARLVVKENVRPLRGRAARFDRVSLPALDRV